MLTCNTLYRVQEPEVVKDGVDGELNIQGEITYTWEENNCETLMVDQNGVVHLVTKVYPGLTTKLYTVPSEAWVKGTVTLESGMCIIKL